MTLRNRKVGGIRFIRIGRLQLSLCWCRPERRREPTLKARLKAQILREVHAIDWALLAVSLAATLMTACTAWAR